VIHGDLGSITDLFIRECVIFRSLFFSLHMIILNFFENSNNCQENCWVFFGFFMKPYSSLKFLKYPRIGIFLFFFFFFFFQIRGTSCSLIMSFSNIQNLVVIAKIKDPPTLVCNRIGQLSNRNRLQRLSKRF